MNYKIVRYDSIYNDQICELEKENWGSNSNLIKSYFQWKYFENPYSDSPKLYLALLEGKVIAVRGVYETKWQLGESAESFIALCSSDLVIHPKHRNKGLHPELMNFMKNDLYDLGYRYLFNFSANPINLISTLAIGWKSIGRIKIMEKQFQRKEFSALISIKKLLKIIGINKVLRRGINKVLSHGEKGNPYIYDIIYKNTKSKVPSRIKIENHPRPEEMYSLVKKLIPKNKIILTRDVGFFSWRYKSPLSDYLFLYWYDNELKGYLVAQTRLYRGLNNFNIIELEAVNSVIKKELLRCLVILLEFSPITIWSNMLDDNCNKFLASIGFSETSSTKSLADYTPTVLVQTTGNSDAKIEFQGCDLLDINNWDLKMIYCDGY